MIEILIKNKYFVSFVLAIITIIFYALDAKLSKKKIDFKTYLKQFVWTFLIILVGYFILTNTFIQNIGQPTESVLKGGGNTINQDVNVNNTLYSGSNEVSNILNDISGSQQTGLVNNMEIYTGQPDF